MDETLKATGDKSSFSKAVFRPVNILAITSIVMTVAILVTREVSHFRTERERIKYEMLEKQKYLVKDEIDHTVKWIERRRQKEMKLIKEVIQKRVNEAYYVSENIYYKFQDTQSNEMLRRLIKETLRPIRFHEEKGFYILLRGDGTILLNDNNRDYEGFNPTKDDIRIWKKSITSVTQIAKEKGEGFFNHLAFKDDGNNKLHTKFSYVKYYAPLDLIIVSGEFTDDIIFQAKKNILERLAFMTFGDDGYIFVNEKHNGLLAQGNVRLKNPEDISNFYMRNTLGDSIPMGDVNQHTDEEFYYYKYHRPNSDKFVNKISYVRYYPDWNWTIGAGIYTDAMEMAIQQKAEELKENLGLSITRILIIAITIVGIIWWQIRKVSDNISQSINQFSTFFKNASTEHVKIDEEKIHYQEFEQLATMANKMLDEREKNKRELQYAYNEIQTSEEELRQQSESLQLTNEHLEEVLKDLRHTQTQLISAEKMASLGQLTAGIAHEINNPINFVSSNVYPLKEDLEDVFSLIEQVQQLDSNGSFTQKLEEIKTYAQEIDLPIVINEIHDLIDGIEEGANRTKVIVQGLRSFSRMDEDDFKQSDIHEGISSTLIILNNKIKKKNITLEKNFGKTPKIECLAGRLNQVIMNILNNAIQAVDENTGKISITTLPSADNREVKIVIKDNGEGIPSTIANKIFDPFFTTKDTGEGTGLGLSISYGIIEQHKGRIEVDSQIRTEKNPDSFTQFTITLPVEQDV